jgi:threonine synthase
MVCVQAEGCAPIVRAWAQGHEAAEPWTGAHTVAAGLRVPAALGDFLILRAIRESGGTALAVSDAALLRGARELAAMEGIAAGPEGGATLAALPLLLDSGFLRPDHRVVCLNTGSALPYAEILSERAPEAL